MTTVVLATSNPHKIAELQAIFASAGVPVIDPRSLPHAARLREPLETGTTFEDNARLKALAYAEQTGYPCLADDSGLEVDALGGRPGVISSHYATGGLDTGLDRPARDAANNARLLSELAGVPASRRTARFVCVMALAAPLPAPNTRCHDDRQPASRPAARLIALTRGVVEGRIGQAGEVPRGDNGFGYDPVFILPDGRTLAELSRAEKAQISHRGQAARAMIPHLLALLAQHASSATADRAPPAAGPKRPAADPGTADPSRP